MAVRRAFGLSPYPAILPNQRHSFEKYLQNFRRLLGVCRTQVAHIAERKADLSCESGRTSRCRQPSITRRELCIRTRLRCVRCLRQSSLKEAKVNSPARNRWVGVLFEVRRGGRQSDEPSPSIPTPNCPPANARFDDGHAAERYHALNPIFSDAWHTPHLAPYLQLHLSL